jgi:hypothetical protein
VEGAAASFEVNLGSAPVEAFEELLDAIAATGATRCIVSAGTGQT